MWDKLTTRKPMLLLRLFGLFLLRYATRALSRLLFQDPPRTTRRSVTGSPTGLGRQKEYRTAEPQAARTSRCKIQNLKTTRPSLPLTRPPVLRNSGDGGQTHHPISEVGFAVGRTVPETKRNARAASVVVPRPAAHYPIIQTPEARILGIVVLV